MNRGWVLATISNYNFCLSGTKDCQKFCCFSAFILVQLYQQRPQKENCYLDLDFILGFSSLGEFSPSSPGCPGSLKLQFLCSQPHEFAYSSSAFSSSWWPPWTFLVSWPVPKSQLMPTGKKQNAESMAQLSGSPFSPGPHCSSLVRQRQSDTFKQTSLLEYFICIFSCSRWEHWFVISYFITARSESNYFFFIFIKFLHTSESIFWYGHCCYENYFFLLHKVVYFAS